MEYLVCKGRPFSECKWFIFHLIFTDFEVVTVTQELDS